MRSVIKELVTDSDAISAYEWHPKAELGDLYVTFKSGRKYVYHAVSFDTAKDVQSRVIEGSIGKTINKLIINRDYDEDEVSEIPEPPKQSIPRPMRMLEDFISPYPTASFSW